MIFHWCLEALLACTNAPRDFGLYKIHRLIEQFKDGSLFLLTILITYSLNYIEAKYNGT
jgi:hypothetical protein